MFASNDCTCFLLDISNKLSFLRSRWLLLACSERRENCASLRARPRARGLGLLPAAADADASAWLTAAAAAARELDLELAIDIAHGSARIWSKPKRPAVLHSHMYSAVLQAQPTAGDKRVLQLWCVWS